MTAEIVAFPARPKGRRRKRSQASEVVKLPTSGRAVAEALARLTERFKALEAALYRAGAGYEASTLVEMAYLSASDELNARLGFPKPGERAPAG